MSRERPILFSGPMVRAILEGRKTQTRRIVRTLPNGLKPNCFVGTSGEHKCFTGGDRSGDVNGLRCPFGAPGDRLWVRETIRADQGLCPGAWRLTYQADGDGVDLSRELPGDARLHFGVSRLLIPSIHMPRWASRLTLEVAAVRVERLQEISQEDAVAEGLLSQVGDGGTPGPGFKWRGTGYEGATPGYFHTPGPTGCSCNAGGPNPALCAFREFWDSINGKRAPWASNPWVWVIEFRRLQ